MLELIVISILNGVLFGMLLFLLSSGLTVIFSMMGVLNFAHASFYMLGAFFGYQLTRWIGFWPALIIAIALAIAGTVVSRSFADDDDRYEGRRLPVKTEQVFG